MKKSALVLVAALLSAGLSTGAAHADTVTLMLTNSSPSTVAGTTLNFDATVSAPSTNVGVEYLNGDSFTVSGPYSLDDSPFFNSFPSSLNPGDSYTGLLFDIVVPPGSSPGSIIGSFQLLGGGSPDDDGTLASVNFDATVGAATSVTPEPPSLVLLSTAALLGIVEVARWRRKARLVLQ